MSKCFFPGNLIHPWNIVDVIVSTRLFTQYPARSTETGDMGDSIVDTHHLMKDHLLFIVGMKMDISSTFYDLNIPKFPLTVDVSVSHVGRSSSHRVYKVLHKSCATRPLVTCAIDDVIVDKVTRKSAPFPDWWDDKYGHLKCSEKSRLSVSTSKASTLLFNDKFTVDFEHVDHNGHTTTSAYVKFCFNAAFRNVHKKNYNSNLAECFSKGINTLTMLFFKESSYGDVLTVASWESEDDTITFQCKNDSGEMCSSVSFVINGLSEGVSKSHL